MSINVLLADDSVPAQNMGKKILVDAGYTVVTVNNGLEALRRIAESAPDVAILDIFMPGYTGLEICKRLRATDATAALPVVLTVGKMEPYRPQEGELVHSNGVIVKPFAAAELIAAVRSLIGAPGAGASAQSAPSIQVAPAKATTSEQQGGWETEEVGSPASPATDHSAAAPEMSTGVSTEPEEDEPLFALHEPSAYSGEPLLSGEASDETANLAFDPDAKRTPFSASAVDLLSTAPYSATGQDDTSFTEFDLEPESPGEVSSPASEVSTAVEEPLIEAREMASSPVEEAELKSSGLDISALDPLLEVRQAQAAPTEPDARSLDVDEPPEQIFPDSAAEHITLATEPPTSPDVAISLDEQARRAAFEALFNSDEETPLERGPDLHPVSAAAVFPGIPELSKDYARDTKPDAELEILGRDDQAHFVDPGMDPNVAGEGQPEDVVPSTIETSSDHELFPDALAHADLHANTVSVPQVGASPDPIPEAAVEAAPAEALSGVYAEPEKPIEEAAQPSEIAPFATEAAPELRQTCIEAALAPQETVERELAHSGEEECLGQAALERIAEEAAILRVAPVSDPAGVAPEHVEGAPVPISALEESATGETSAVESADSRNEELVGDNLPFSGVTARKEAERVHQAVERVFERLKPLIIAAIVRELARSD